MTRPYALGHRKLPMTKEDETKIHQCGHESMMQVTAKKDGEHTEVKCLECGFGVELKNVTIDWSNMSYSNLLKALDGSGRG